jgi:hypothetical protein
LEAAERPDVTGSEESNGEMTGSCNTWRDDGIGLGETALLRREEECRCSPGQAAGREERREYVGEVKTDFRRTFQAQTKRQAESDSTATSIWIGG